MLSKSIISKLVNINKEDLHQPKSIWSTFKNAYLKRKNLKKFWKKLDKKNLSDEIIKITDLFINSESYTWTSKFWRHAIINHYKHIINTPAPADPLSAISRSDYAGFIFMDEFSIKKSFENLNGKIQLNLDLFKKHPELSLTDSINHNLVLLILYENIKSKNIFKSYDKIGKDLYIKYNPTLLIEDKIISQYMLISLLEYEKIKILTNSVNRPLNILELGAGYGRTANMIMSLSKDVKYVIADLPPSVFFSKKNLTQYFPSKKIKTAFEIDNKSEMMKLYETSDILFIFPHQINLFEKKCFDISIAIGNLCEMEKDQITNYMKIFENFSNFLYFRVWENSGLPYSFYKYYSVHKKSDYSIKENWIEHFKDRCIIPSNQFEVGYEFKD